MYYELRNSMYIMIYPQIFSQYIALDPAVQLLKSYPDFQLDVIN